MPWGGFLNLNSHEKVITSSQQDDGTTHTEESLTNSQFHIDDGSDRETKITGKTVTDSDSFVAPSSPPPEYSVTDPENSSKTDTADNMSAACDNSAPLDPFQRYCSDDVPRIPELNAIIPFSLFPSPHEQTILLQMADIAFGRDSIPDCGFFGMDSGCYYRLVENVVEYAKMANCVASILPPVASTNSAFGDSKLSPELKEDWHRFHSFLALCTIQLVGAVNYSNPMTWNRISIFQMEKGNYLSSSLAWLANDIYSSEFMKKRVRPGPRAFTQRNTPVSEDAHRLWALLQSIDSDDLIKKSAYSVKVPKNNGRVRNNTNSRLGEETAMSMYKKAHQLLLQLALVWNRAGMANEGHGTFFVQMGSIDKTSKPASIFDSFNREIQRISIRNTNDPNWIHQSTLNSESVALPVVAQHVSRMFDGMLSNAPLLRGRLLNFVVNSGLSGQPWASRLVHGLDQFVYLSYYWNTSIFSRDMGFRSGSSSHLRYTPRPSSRIGGGFTGGIGGGFDRGMGPRPGFDTRPGFGPSLGVGHGHSRFGHGRSSFQNSPVFDPHHRSNHHSSFGNSGPFGSGGHFGSGGSRSGFGSDPFGSSPFDMADDMMHTLASTVESMMPSSQGFMDDASSFVHDDLPDFGIDDSASDAFDVFAEFEEAKQKLGSDFKFL